MDHKNVPGTTDCLTFDLSGPHTPKGCIEGDLVLCLAEAKRQAKARGHSAREELLLYAIHGLLHLDGEDDLEPKAFAKMHKREDAILRKIGFQPLFAGK
jgi:probable rRNA maturation factor